MTDALWKQVLSAAVVFAVIIIVLALMGLIPQPVKDIFSVLGFGGEEKKEGTGLDENYLNIIKFEPESLKNGIYAYAGLDWIGEGKSKLGHGAQITLEFNKEIGNREEINKAKEIVSDKTDIMVGSTLYDYEEDEEDKDLWVLKLNGEATVDREYMQENLLGFEGRLKPDILNAKKEENVWNVQLGRKKDCIRIWESERFINRKPTKQEHWTFVDKKSLFIDTKGKELTISGFEGNGFWFDAYYMIEFPDCFKSVDGKTINPKAAIMKFRVE